MSLTRQPRPSLLSTLIRLATCGSLVAVAPALQAHTVVLDDQLIDHSTPQDSYHVFSPATLTARGAKTLDIMASAGATLDLQDTLVEGGAAPDALSINGATATLRNSTVTGDNRGLTTVPDDAGQASRVQVFDSSISAGSRGALINNSEVYLERSQLRATKANGIGAELFDGTLIARDSQVVGGQYGIRVRDGSQMPAGQATVTLDNSHVEGLTGAAISVGRGAGRAVSASIEVLNGSTLTGGNGVLLEVADAATATLRVNDSRLVGDVIVEAGGTARVTLENAATLTGRLIGVEHLALDSDAEWVMVESSQLNALSLDGGVVRFGQGATPMQLQLDTLTGNGTFAMNVDFARGLADFLEVTGQGTGNHQLRIASSGSDPLADSSLHMVHVKQGDAHFSLEGGPVDLGAYAYDLVRKGPGNDWYLDTTTRKASNGTQAVMALFNSAPTLWYGELSTLRSRMGEVRRDTGQHGVWVRSFGNRYDVSSAAGVAYRQNQQGLALGADGRLVNASGTWLLGVTAGTSSADLNLRSGTTARVDSHHVGTYATWLDPEHGYYLDASARLSRFGNRAEVRLSDGAKSKGRYDNFGGGLALEGGRHVALSDGYFLEPYLQWSALAIQGKDYRLDNGMRAEGQTTRSLQGKLGTTVGRTFEMGDGRRAQPYLRVATAHEFIDRNQVKVNGHRFNTNLSGTRGEVGAGIAVNWQGLWQVNADFEYSHGKKLEQPWGAGIGVRYNW